MTAENLIQQILEFPGEITDHHRADHAAAAFEGVEGAANDRQRRLVFQIFPPADQFGADGHQGIARFFEKNFHEFGIGIRKSHQLQRVGFDNDGFRFLVSAARRRIGAWMGV